MSKKYDLSKYKMAMHVTADFPIIINEIMNIQKSIKKYRRYASVEAIWESLEENKEMLRQDLNRYSKVLSKKGAKDE